MKRLFILVFPLCMAMLLSAGSCNRERDAALFARLQQWETVVEEQPRAIQDSLEAMDANQLSRANRAYYGLLKTITDDKTFTEFTSDSLINSVEKYYRSKKNNAHIRALTYQGIVRLRMNITDSTAYIPLKEAEEQLKKQKNTEPALAALIYIHLGLLHSNTSNRQLAQQYYNTALNYAKKENNLDRTLTVYSRIYWELLKQDSITLARSYLDTLQQLTHTPEQHYYLLNARSIYLSLTNEYDLALQKEKEQIPLLSHLREKPQYHRAYYSLSDAYYGANRLDSALHYGLLATEHITDSIHRLNYLLYDHVADIAAAQNNYKLADEYRAKALKAHEQSITNEIDKHIVELEKRYDLTEANNKTLKAKQQNIIWLAVASTATLLLLLLGVYIHKQGAIAKLKEQQAAEKALRLQAEKQQIQEYASRQQELIDISANFLSEYATLQENAKEMVTPIIAKDTKLGENYERMLKKGQKRFDALAENLFSEEEFSKTFNINTRMDIFTPTDRLLLIMLAAGTSNKQIAAMLNIIPENLKHRKTYLKRKIKENATPQNNFARLLELFITKNKKKQVVMPPAQLD